MNKKIVIALGLSLSTLSTVQAAPLMKSLQHHAIKHQAAKEGDYTDFTGTWTSSNCMGQEVTLEIENDKQMLRINQEELMIGNMSTKSNTGDHNLFDLTTESEVQSLEWNADKTQLIFRSVSVDKKFDLQTEAGIDVDTSMYIDMDHVTLALENDSLKIKFNTATYKDLQKIDSAHPTCSFTKAVNPQ